MRDSLAVAKWKNSHSSMGAGKSWYTCPMVCCTGISSMMPMAWLGLRFNSKRLTAPLRGGRSDNEMANEYGKQHSTYGVIQENGDCHWHVIYSMMIETRWGPEQRVTIKRDAGPVVWQSQEAMSVLGQVEMWLNQ